MELRGRSVARRAAAQGGPLRRRGGRARGVAVRVPRSRACVLRHRRTTALPAAAQRPQAGAPENSRSGERKVLDFGMAKVLEQARDLATDVGRTIAYAAPERLRSEQVNVHADFWSLGRDALRDGVGHRPYPDARGSAPPPPAVTARSPATRRARRCRPICPPHLQAIIHRLLAFQPAHRYQMRTRSRPISTRSSVVTCRAPSPSTKRRPRRR